MKHSNAELRMKNAELFILFVYKRRRADQMCVRERETEKERERDRRWSQTRVPKPNPMQ